MEAGLEAVHYYDPPNLTFPFGTYICVVDIDKGTGEVKVRRFVAVDDCGNIINPMIVEGQIHGGLTEGLGIAFMQLISYDESGNVQGGNFMDYLVAHRRRDAALGDGQDLHALAASSDRREGRGRIAQRRFAGGVRQRGGGCARRTWASRTSTCRSRRGRCGRFSRRKDSWTRMAVRIEKTFRVREPIDKVWDLLSDPRKVVSCVPGAQITEAVDDRTFKGAISVKVGPSVTEYKGEVKIVRLDAAGARDRAGRQRAGCARQGQRVDEDDRHASGADGRRHRGRRRSPKSTWSGFWPSSAARMMNDVSDVIFGEFTQRFQSSYRKRPQQPPRLRRPPRRRPRLLSNR